MHSKHHLYVGVLIPSVRKERLIHAWILTKAFLAWPYIIIRVCKNTMIIKIVIRGKACPDVGELGHEVKVVGHARGTVEALQADHRGMCRSPRLDER